MNSRKTPPIPPQEQMNNAKPDFRELLNRAGHSYRVSRFGRFMTNPFISLGLLLVCTGMLFQLAVKERTIESLENAVYYADADWDSNWNGEEPIYFDEDGDGEFEYDGEYPLAEDDPSWLESEDPQQIRELEKRIEDLEKVTPSKNAQKDSRFDEEEPSVLPEGPAIGA